MKNKNAYLTVYLTLCLAVLLPLCLTLIDGVRRNGAAMEATCAAEVGLQNIFAEYHRELLAQYNLFAIDSSYGTTVCGKENTEAHLQGYLGKNLQTEEVFLSDYLYRDFLGLYAESAGVRGVSLLTDGNGAVFRSMAIDAIRDDVGINLLESVQDWMKTIEVNGLSVTEPGNSDLDSVLAEYNGTEMQISENETAIVQIGNPVREVEQRRRRGILSLVVENQEALSARVLVTEGLVENRSNQGLLNVGNMGIPNTDGIGNNILFREYLLRYMGCYGVSKDSGALSYQIEYLIAGKAEDTENLRSIATRLCAVREAANMVHLYADQEKSREIRTTATAVCGVFFIPELIPVLETAIRLGWAYAESIYDVKTLLAGGKIPLMKDKDSWHCSLSNALGGGQEETSGEGKGLAYQDYLRILMMLTDTDTLTMRAMNMVEADIRLTQGNNAFRLDGCYRGVDVTMKFGSSFGYEFEIQREKYY